MRRLAARPKASAGDINRQSSICNRQSSPILLTETKAGRDLVASCCDICLEAGVKPGMTLAHARALLPSFDLHVEPHTPARDLAALRALAQWMIRFAPLVSLDPPDGLLLDITGCARLYLGERRLINRIADSIQRLGLHVRIASAPTFACARAVARAGRRQRSFVPDECIREALAPLPVRALGIDEETEDALREIAIDRIGHLFDLPRNSLPARFGDDLLLRLDQALGQAIETIDPIRPAPPPEIERLFNGPVRHLEAIEITVRELLEDLSRQLLQRESGVGDLVLTLDRSDLDPLHISIALSHPSRDVKHLWSLLSPHAERANMGFGVERVALRADKIDRLLHEQWEIEERRSDEATKRRSGETCLAASLQASAAVLARAHGELFDTLINRLGRDNVLRLEPVEAHIPERAFRMVTVMEEKARSHKGTEARRERCRDKETKLTEGPAQRRRSGECGDARRPAGQSDRALRETARGVRQSPHHQISVTSHDRPTVLFDPPEPIEVMAVTPESPPVRLTWRGMSHEVCFGCGPERIGEVWWDERRHEGTEARRHEAKESDELTQRTTNHEPRTNRQSSIINQSISLILLQRSYYRVLLEDGRWLWVFRHLLSRAWFVHGEWA